MWQFSAALLVMAERQEVLGEFERLYFPREPDLAWLDQVKQGMANLHDLIAKKNHEMSWSRKWFLEIQVEQSNPVKLALFAAYWMDLLIPLRKEIR